jgi:hypothetical protein
MLSEHFLRILVSGAPVTGTFEPAFTLFDHAQHTTRASPTRGGEI